MSRGGQRVFAGPVLAGGPVVLAPAPPVGAEQFSPREREIQQRALAAGRSEGVRTGHEAGLAEGRRAADAELASAAQALAQAMADLAAQRQRFLAEAKHAVLRLALAIARKVVHGEVSPCGGEAAARVVEAALASAREATALRVRLSPKDREHVGRVHRKEVERESVEGGAQGKEATAGPAATPSTLHSPLSTPSTSGVLFFQGVELVADPSISPGGCVVETDCGAIDAQVETQWGEVQAALQHAAAQILAAESESAGA